jgi:hypothetical protein
VSRTIRLTLSAIGALALLGAAVTHAQTPRPAAPRLQVAQGENLSAGKTPAQLFASDCSACHRSPAGLAKGRGPGPIATFLVEHYTSSRQTAGLLGAYVASMRGPAPAAARTPAAERPAAALRPPSELSESEQGLLPGERNLDRSNGQPQRPTGTVARGRGAAPPTARTDPAAQRAEPAAGAEPEIRAETAPPSPSATPAPRTLESLEVYD